MATETPEIPDRQRLEVRKLIAETQKLQHEITKLEQAIPEAVRTYRLDRLRTIATAVTATVAILGLFSAVYTQQRDARRNAEVRRDDARRNAEVRRDDLFAEAVKQLGDAKEELGRVAAINAIAVFSSDLKYEPSVRHLLLQALPVIREERTRTAISEALALHPTPVLLINLVQLNRALQKQIETRVVQKMSDASTNAVVQNAEKYDERLELDPPDYRVMVWPDRWAREDAKLQELLDDLGWSAETTLAVMNSLREIHDVDLSHLVFTRIELSGLPKFDPMPTFGDPVRCRSVEAPVIGVTLRHVDLSNSVLACVDFEKSTFDDVAMDNTTLYRSTFDSCSLNSVSWDSFRSWVSLLNDHGIHAKAPVIERSYLVGPVWKNCTLTASKFSAKVPSPEHQKAPRGIYFRFDQSTWQIRAAAGVAAPPAAGRKTDFEGSVSF